MSAARWDCLGQFYSSPGVLTEVIHVYLARELTPCDAAPEEHEVFDASWIPLSEAVGLATAARLQDAKTIIGLAWAQARLAGQA
jgi:ADP-ribose pyrophosphatase